MQHNIISKFPTKITTNPTSKVFDDTTREFVQ